MSRKREPESSIVGLVDADENLDMLDFDADKDADADYIEADLGTDDSDGFKSSATLERITSYRFNFIINSYRFKRCTTSEGF